MAEQDLLLPEGLYACMTKHNVLGFVIVEKRPLRKPRTLKTVLYRVLGPKRSLGERKSEWLVWFLG